MLFNHSVELFEHSVWSESNTYCIVGIVQLGNFPNFPVVQSTVLALMEEGALNSVTYNDKLLRDCVHTD